MTRFSDVYQLEERAARGGMGTVWRARDLRSGATVAVKLLDRASEGGLTRFAREARVLAALHHPAIVHYLDHGATEEGVRYLVTEWLDGVTLEDRLAKGPLGLGESVRLIRQVADALATVHLQGVVHRDIKPSNLFLVDGELDGVKMLDFGLALLDGTALSATRTGHLVGTPEYMSPEQARGDKGVDARADVFSLGCVLYEALTGISPFDGEHLVAVLGKILFAEPTPVTALRPEIPGALADLVGRMLAKDRERRPDHAGDVLTALAALPVELAIGDEAGRPRPATPAPFGWSAQQVVSVVIAAYELHDVPTSATAPGIVRASVGDDATVVDDRPTLSRLRGKTSSLGATIEQLTKDAYIATLAGAASATDQAAAAARCALRLRDELPGTTLVVVTGHGVIGGAIPVGDVIDRAVGLLRSRSAGPGAIRLDDVTSGLLDARFQVSADANGVALVGERSVNDTQRTLLGRPTAFVGRHRELAALEGAFAACVEESMPHAAVVLAGPGIGKSRLRYELARRITVGNPTAQVLTGWGDPTHAGAALSVLCDALRRSIGLRDGEPAEAGRARLHARVGRHLDGEDRDRIAAFLGEIVGVPFPDHGLPALRAARQEPRLLADHMRRAFIDWLAAETAADPVMIIVEDLHWADAASLGFIDAALGALADRRLFVLGLGRPGVDALFPELWGERALDRIVLGELPARAAESLARQVLGEGASPEVIRRIVDLAGGNAFHLEELIRAVAEGRGDQLPESVVAMTQSRLETLPTELRRILRAAAVVGDRFWRGAVSAVLGESPPVLRPGSARSDSVDRVAAWLTQLADAELVSRRPDSRIVGEDEYGFRHALVLDAAYASLTPGDRAVGHGRAADWLAERDADAVTIAEHLDRSDRAGEAAPWWCRAADRALDCDELDAALRHAERALARTPAREERGRARLVVAEALAWRGDLAGAASAASEALDLLEIGGARWFRAARAAMGSAGRLADYARVEELAAATLAAPATDDAASAQVAALCAATTQMLHAGRYAPAIELAGRVDSLARRRTLDAATEAEVHRLRAACARQFGDPHGDATGYRAALDAYERAGDTRAACNARVSYGFALIELGDLAPAEAEIRRALDDAERLGLGPIATRARQNLGLVLAERGALAEADVVEQRAADEARAQGNARFEGGSRVYLSQIALRRGDAVRAETEAAAAARLFAPTPPARAGALAAWSRALLAQGRKREALRVAVEAKALLDRLGSVEEYEYLIRGAHAEALIACDRHDDASAAVTDAMQRLLGRTACIPGDVERKRFLEHDSDNAAIVGLAAWFGVTTSEDPDDTMELMVADLDLGSGSWDSADSRTQRKG